MSAHLSARILPMRTAGTEHLIERTYREGGTFQWAREVVVNSIEGGATRIEFGIEWQAVENRQVYRRVIADDGCGMSAEELVAFFNTFGGGGKPIGEPHQNFGVGSKTSLLPWNKYGVVVISWKDGDASMIWIRQSETTSEYGLQLERCIGQSGNESLEVVYDPYDDPQHGCNWAQVKPSWIDDHGTVIVLLGNSPTDDTVLGDPTREEKDIKGISSYLNRRFWKFPDNTEMFVDELRSNDRVNWPPNEEIAFGQFPDDARDRRVNHRQIRGARYHIEYLEPKITKRVKGSLKDSGTVPLSDGTEVDWFLWEGDRPSIHTYAAMHGYVAALYKDELYDVSNHHSTFRSFGVSDNSVRQNLWLIVRPPLDGEEKGKRGVYPKTDRNSLLVRWGPTAGQPLPMVEWATEFAANMPESILSALSAARQDESDFSDDGWREKLQEKFAARWRLPWLRASASGTHTTTPENNGPTPIRRSKPRFHEPTGPREFSNEPRIRPPKEESKTVFGKTSEGVQAELAYVEPKVPGWEKKTAADLGGVLAAWQPVHEKHPHGAVLINVEHPVLVSVIEYWQSQYADHHAADIARDVIQVYGMIAVSKVAHSEYLKGILPTEIVETQLRSEAALTMSLLGIMAEDHLISTRIGGKYSKKKRSSAAIMERVRRQPR